MKPPEQEPERSTEATEKPSEPVEKEKGLEMEKRESEVPKDLPEPEIPEKPFVETEKAQEATSEQEVTFRMKAWSNWLHRQDQKDEEKRIKNRARQRALRQQRRSDRIVGLQQAVRKGPSVRRAWTVSKADPEPRGSIRKVLKRRKERTVKVRLVEREVQASRVTAKGEYMAQDRHKVWVAPKRRPRASGSQEPEKVTKGFVEFQPSGARGISLVSLTGSETSDVGDLEEIRGALPESAPTPTKGPKSVSSGLTGHERITSEINSAYPRGCARGSVGATTGHKAWNRVLHEEKARGAGEREIHVSGPSDLASFEQRRGVGRGCIHFWIGSSRSSSPDLDRREFTASRNSQKDPEENPILAANEGEGQTGGTPTSTGSTPGVAGSSGRQTGGDGRSGSCQAEGASESGKRRSGENVGSDCSDGNSGAENSTDSGPKKRHRHQQRDPKRNRDRSPKSKKRWQTRC